MWICCSRRFLFLIGIWVNGIGSKVHHYTVIDYIKKRLSKVYIPFIVINIIYVIMALTMNIGISVKGMVDIFAYIIGLKLIDDVTWFILVLLLFYVFFLFVTFVRKRYQKMTLLLAMTFIYAILGFTILNIPFYAIVSTPAFPLGVIVSLYKDEICSVLRQIWLRMAFFVLFLIVCCFSVSVMTGYILLPKSILHFVIAINNISLLFLLVIIFANKNYQWFKCNWLGNISYEVYLTHNKLMQVYVAIVGTWIPFLGIDIYYTYCIYPSFSLQHIIEITVSVGYIIVCANRLQIILSRLVASCFSLSIVMIGYLRIPLQQ
jgi:membrane-bound acyltransferase YfiQ involved in biofilm formation